LSLATNTKNIQAEVFQWKFYTALERFPSMIAGVGTGKTLWALLKADLLSRLFRGNVGAIVRSKFTDLRDSTMHDYTELTGKNVPQNTKEVYYSNGSKIMFRHAKELSGLKNTNLGWAYIEQAEEFPTESQFDMLRFRLRHNLDVDTDYVSELRRNGGLMPFIEKMIDHPENQMFVIANANGHNWCWKRFVKSPIEGSMCIQATSFDNSWMVKNKPDTIRDWRQMEIDNPTKFRQYVMNDHSEVDLDACFYSEAMSDLRKNGQIGHVAYDPSRLVHLAFDMGFDCTAIWFFQIKGQSIHVIDYYENTGKPVSHYASVLGRKKYNYGKMVLPHDAKKREMTSGITLSKSFKDLEYDVVTLQREQNIDFGINNVLNILPRCWFDETKCEDGLEALNHYRREYSEELKIFLKKPLHDWASHPSDSFRYLCSAVKKNLFAENGLDSASVSELDIKKWENKYRRIG